MRVRMQRRLVVEHGEGVDHVITSCEYRLTHARLRMLKAKDGTIAGMGVLNGIAAIGVGLAAHCFGFMDPWLAVLPVGVVTASGITAIASSMAGSPTADISQFNWHAAGFGTAPESPADLDLDLSLPVARGQGEQSLPNGNVYRTVGVVMFNDTYTVTEWGLFSAPSGGVLFDRALIEPVPVISGHWIRFTYDLTFEAGA